MGIRQAERHSTLTATFTGSNPVCPAMDISSVRRACYKYMSQVQILHVHINLVFIDTVYFFRHFWRNSM